MLKIFLCPLFQYTFIYGPINIIIERVIPIERTFLMVKPDGVKRGLIGEVYKRIEKCGLKIVAMKMIYPTKKQAEIFYPSDEEWLLSVGKKGKKTYEEKGILFKWKLKEYGLLVRSWLVNFLVSGPVVVSIIEGPNAIEIVRKIVGNTEPRQAPFGTIRGNFSTDSYDLANRLRRPAKNIVHASSDAKEAEREIKVWFTENEIVNYKRVDEDLIFGKQ